MGDEDDEFYGFAGPLPAVPAPDWGDTERMDLVHVHPYNRASGPTNGPAMMMDQP